MINSHFLPKDHVEDKAHKCKCNTNSRQESVDSKECCVNVLMSVTFWSSVWDYRVSVQIK